MNIGLLLKKYIFVIGTIATIFQSELILLNWEQSFDLSFANKIMKLFSNSEAVHKDLGSNRIHSNLVWNCVNNLETSLSGAKLL